MSSERPDDPQDREKGERSKAPWKPGAISGAGSRTGRGLGSGAPQPARDKPTGQPEKEKPGAPPPPAEKARGAASKFTPPRTPAAAAQPHRAPSRAPQQESFAARARAMQPRTSYGSIPRSQRWLFWGMLVLVAGMATYLIRLRERASDRFAAASQPLPLSSADAAEQPLRLYLANDLDGSLVERPLRFPLPADPNARARVVLEKLLEEYAAPGSLHPLTANAGVEEVFLLPVPGSAASAHSLLAVVNLTPAFVQNHPSGIEPESLTLLSMIATLRANLPTVTQVRFLVDGRQQATLAGHADLTRAYLAASTQMALDGNSPFSQNETTQ